MLKNTVTTIIFLTAELNDLNRKVQKLSGKLTKELNSTEGTFTSCRETGAKLMDMINMLRVKAEALQAMVDEAGDDIKSMTD